MKNESVALARVSSARQRVEGSSLESQEAHVYEFSEKNLGSGIEKIWSLDVSSKAGKNVKRKDLEEILRYCKEHRYIKYFIVDKVNRLMREIKMFYWYIYELEKIGVKTYFADPQQQDLNGDDQIAQLKTFLAIYEAERDNKERANTTITRMKDRTLQGYYLFPLHQGYKTSETPGLHIPDGESFELLQMALRNVASGIMNKHEAFMDLTKKGYKAPSGKDLRIDVFNKILVDDFYAGYITVNKWDERFHRLKGLHIPMITEAEHEAIKGYMKGKKTVIRKQHNDEFPLSNLLHCECGGKFVGLMQGNGKGNFYPRYRCRTCGRQLRRDDLHLGTQELIDTVRLPEGFKKKVLTSMELVWRDEQKFNLAHVNTLQNRKIELNEAKTNLVIELSKNPDLSDDFKIAIEKIKTDIQEIEGRIKEAEKIEDDLTEFVSFALDFIENKQERVWDLDFEDRQRFKQLVFPGEIYLDFKEKVCTHLISPILNLIGTKKEAQNTSISTMVGLVGLEPTTKGL